LDGSYKNYRVSVEGQLNKYQKFQILENIKPPENKFKLMSTSVVETESEHYCLPGYHTSALRSKKSYDKVGSNSLMSTSMQGKKTLSNHHERCNTNEPFYDQRKNMSITTYQKLQNWKPGGVGKFAVNLTSLT
jgi:hypothetical protein